MWPEVKKQGVILGWMAVVILAATGSIFFWLYSLAVDQEGKRLRTLATVQASNVSEYNFNIRSQAKIGPAQPVPHDLSSSPFGFLLHRFGETGELQLLQKLPNWKKTTPLSPIPKNLIGISEEPQVDNPTFIARTSQGSEVIAALVPISGRSLWVMAKVDLAEIRRPYIYGGVWAWILEGGIILLVWTVWRRSKISSDQELREREEKIRAIVVSSGEGVVTFDKSGLIVSVNEAAEHLFGYPEKEVIGRPFQSLIVPEGHDGCDDFIITDQLSGQKGIAGSQKEFMGRRNDGTFFIMVLTMTEAPLWGNRYFTVLVRDVTQRKLAERRLAAQYAVAQVLAKCTSIQQATPEILQAICESLGWQLGILWEVDPSASYLNCVEVWGPSSERFSEFVKFTQSMSFKKGVGLPGRVWEKGGAIWIPDAVKDKNFPRGPMASKNSLHAAFGFPIRLGDATLGVMEFFSREIQEPDEALLHQMLSLGSQIGQFMQRIETETALRAREEQTRLILDTALDAVITLDEEGCIIEWNAQAEQLFGWSRQEILGQSLANTIVPSQYREAHRRGILRYVESGESHFLNTRFEMTGLHRDGHEIPLELAITAVRSKGKVIFNGFLRDLTERRKGEEALLKSEEQLRQAQKMEAIGTLAGGIAHDFNNILSAIIGYTELAMAQIGIGSAILPKLQEVLKASYRAKNLVRQILTFSRQDASGKKVVQLQPIIAEALDLLRASLPSTIRLAHNLQSPTSSVMADATQIHQVVMNLGANAEYAMRETGGTLDVTMREVDIDESLAMTIQGLSPGKYIRLQVMDSGLGIAPSIKKRIFDPFFTTKDVGQGTGMGLAVIHGIVKSHGGGIQVESQEGVGSTFTLYFPCSLMPLDGETKSILSESYYGHGRIMFVDDEVSITRWAKDMLEELGYQVVVHTNGQEAIDDFQSRPHQFDALISDQTMPGMTGEMLARRVMAIRPGFPVILCSGFSYTMSEEKALGMGIIAYLQKPVLMRDLARTLHVALTQPVGQEEKY